MIESPSAVRFTRRVGTGAMIAAALVLVSTGCSDQPPVSEAPATETSVSKVDVEVLDEARFVEVLQSNRGKVVLVDFWAPWCGPCLELLPHTIELHARYGDKGLRVVTVSLDEPAQKSTVLKVLRENEAALPNYISKYGAGGRSFEIFDISNGALPHFKLYDRDGKLAGTFPAEGENVNPDEIDRAVKELLGGVEK